MSGRKAERVHHLIHDPTVGRNAAHGVADGIAAVKEQRTPLQPRKQVLGELVNHAAAAQCPGPGQSHFERAVQCEQNQAAENGYGQHMLRRRFQREGAEECLKPGRQRQLSQDMVGQQGQRQRLQGRQR